MNISKRQAIQFINEKIDKLKDLKSNAAIGNCYGPSYEKVYYGIEDLVESLFDTNKKKEFRLNVALPIAIDDNEEDSKRHEFENYVRHLDSCISQLEVLREHVENFWKDETNSSTDAANNAPKNQEFETQDATKPNNRLIIVTLITFVILLGLILLWDISIKGSELGISAFCLFSIAFSSLVWGIHQYTYPSKSDIEKKVFQRRVSENGFWNVAKGYQCYTHRTGEPSLKDHSHPLVGIINAFLISLTIFMLIYIIALLWSELSQTGVIARPYLISGGLFIISCLILPYFFVLYSNLPGGIRDFPDDMPLTPIWWGALIGAYGWIAILKLYGIDLATEVLSILEGIPVIKGVSLIGLPIAWFIIIRMLTKGFLDHRDIGEWNRSQAIFHFSWGISTAACIALSIILMLL